MAITLVGVQTSTDDTCAVPSGLADEDVLVAHATSIGAGTPSAPAGWTAIALAVSTSGNVFAGGWLRVVSNAASEPTSYTWTNTSNLTLAAYRGVDATTPQDVSGEATSSGGSSTKTQTLPSVTVHDGAMLISGAIAYVGCDPPTGWTSQASFIDSSIYRSRYADDSVSAGATGDLTWTTSYGIYGVWLGALKPIITQLDASATIVAAESTADGIAAQGSAGAAATVSPATATAAGITASATASATADIVAASATADGIAAQGSASAAASITPATSTADGIAASATAGATADVVAASATADGIAATASASATAAIVPATATATGITASGSGGATADVVAALSTADGIPAAGAVIPLLQIPTSAIRVMDRRLTATRSGGLAIIPTTRAQVIPTQASRAFVDDAPVGARFTVSHLSSSRSLLHEGPVAARADGG